MERRGAVVIEFFGIPRQQAGRADLAVTPGTVAQLLQRIQETCPNLKDLRQPDGRLSSHYLVSINGERFVTDLGQQLRDGDRLLLLSADAGG